MLFRDSVDGGLGWDSVRSNPGDEILGCEEGIIDVVLEASLAQ